MNELKFGNKVVFVGGQPLTLPTAAADPGSAVDGDLYYNTVSDQVRIYQNGTWASMVMTEGTQTINGNKTLSGTINLSALTASKPLSLDAGKNIVSQDIALTSQVTGVLPIANGGTNSSTALNNDRVMKSSAGAIVEAAAITAARALISDANGIPTHSVTTAAELAFVNGVTSAIQTQLNAKVNSTDLAATTDGASGASLVGIDQTPAFTNFTPTGATVQGALEGINTALGAGGNDKLVKISVADTTSDYLAPKIQADIGTNATNAFEESILNPGANEILRLRFDASKVDHGALVGLADDDHTQYILVAGTRAFTGNQAMGGNKLTGLAAGSGAGDSVRYEQAILRDGSQAFTAAQSMGSFNLTNVADPTLAQHAATKAYVDSLIDGRDWKNSVKAATTAALTLASDFENGDAIDGITLATNDRILIKDQASAGENGIYIVQASGAPVRSSDADAVAELIGAAVFVEQGTANGDKQFAQTGDGGTFAAVSVWVVTSANSFSGHDMVSLTGGAISIDLAAVSGLESSNAGNAAGQLRIKLEASNPSLRITGSNELAAKLDAAGTITSGASGLKVGVDNSTIEIATNALQLKALGITNSHVSASAAIAYSKLALSNSIVNADIASGAAIARNKLAALTANRAMVTDASGFDTVSATTDTEIGYVSGVTSAIQTQLDGKALRALSNLAAVAINTSLVSDTDNTDDLGTDAIEWKDIWAYSLKHNSAGTPNLSISTTGNNGSVVLGAHGTGNLDIQATKLRRSQDGASSNFMEDQYLDGLTLTAAVVAPTEISSSLSFALASFDGATVDYRIKEATSNKVRIGQFIVSSDGTITSSSDQFSETAILGSALGLSFSADVSGGNVRILYNNTHATNAATMRCQIRRFRA